MMSDQIEQPSYLAARDKAMVASWQKGLTANKTEFSLAISLDVIRQSFPAAFRYIVRTDPVAGKIARAKEWLHERHRPEQTDLVGLAQQQAIDDVLTGFTTPPAVSASAVRPDHEPLPRPKPAYLTKEQLALARWQDAGGRR